MCRLAVPPLRVEPSPELHVAPAARAPVPAERSTVHTEDDVLAAQLAAALARRVAMECPTAARALARQVNVRDLVDVADTHCRTLMGLPVSFASARMAA